MPQRAEAAPARTIDRNIQVRFDANVDQSLPWSFAPVVRQVDVKIGETTLAFFKADNKSDAPVKGTAVFNVVPEQAARYFNKIECFCFKEQTLAPRQSVEMPVTFFIDPRSRCRTLSTAPMRSESPDHDGCEAARRLGRFGSNRS